MQKKDPKYYDLKEETAWTMEQFNEYINKFLCTSKNLEKDWVLNILPVSYILLIINFKKMNYFI